MDSSPQCTSWRCPKLGSSIQMKCYLAEAADCTRATHRLNVLLGVVPRAAGVGHGHSHLHAADQGAGQHACGEREGGRRGGEAEW